MFQVHLSNPYPVNIPARAEVTSMINGKVVTVGMIGVFFGNSYDPRSWEKDKITVIFDDELDELSRVYLQNSHHSYDPKLDTIELQSHEFEAVWDS